MYAIYTFGPNIMNLFGLDHGHDSILGEAVISLIFLLGTVPAMHWLNKFGRRKNTPCQPCLHGYWLAHFRNLARGPVWIILFALVCMHSFRVRRVFYSGSTPNELFPTEIRATAVGVAIGFSRIGTIISTSILPWCLVEFGIGPTMLAGAALVLFALLVSWHLHQKRLEKH